MNKQQMKKWYQQYKASKVSSVYGFYKNPSHAKVRSEILNKNYYGGEYRVLSGNCSYYTSATQTENEFIVFTYANDYKIALSELQ